MITLGLRLRSSTHPTNSKLSQSYLFQQKIPNQQGNLMEIQPTAAPLIASINVFSASERTALSEFCSALISSQIPAGGVPFAIRNPPAKCSSVDCFSKLIHGKTSVRNSGRTFSSCRTANAGCGSLIAMQVWMFFGKWGWFKGFHTPRMAGENSLVVVADLGRLTSVPKREG